LLGRVVSAHSGNLPDRFHPWLCGVDPSLTMLVSLAKLALGTDLSPRKMLDSLAGIHATLVRTTTGGMGRRPTVALPPELTAEQRRAVKVFELARWMPSLLSCMKTRPLSDEDES